MEIIKDVIEIVSKDNFSEKTYLEANPDVKKAIENAQLESAYIHFINNGIKENRKQYNPEKFDRIIQIRKAKFDKLGDNLLKNSDYEFKNANGQISFLSSDIKSDFNITDTNNVSSNNYDDEALELIKEFKDGLILDCGAGLRDKYYSNIINYEIVDYYTTDIIGVAEKLPFADNTFDAVISVAVLEHVKDPFLAASEISRVLKKGGKLYSCIPFLQPFHGYPHHYYNMTSQGHSNLYEKTMEIKEIKVIDFIKPIYSLTWFLRSYVNGLPEKDKKKFMKMKVKDLLNEPKTYLDKDFVKNLNEDANMELASATLIRAIKR